MKNILLSSNRIDTRFMFYSQVQHSFENKVENKQQYTPRSRSHESYISLLHCLLEKADFFTLISLTDTSKLQTILYPYLYSKEINEYGNTVFVYYYIKEVKDILSMYENFSSYEEDVELLFTAADGTCLLDAVPHHDMISINAQYFIDIDSVFIDEEKRLTETCTRSKIYSGEYGVPYVLGDNEEWGLISQILYWTSDFIQIGDSRPTEFTEELYAKIATYSNQYAGGDMRTFRNGYLLFFADAKERRSTIDYCFISNLENYREPFREEEYRRIMEQNKNNSSHRMTEILATSQVRKE